MADKPRFYLTTAISYPNGVPHIGHAYEAIATDAIARFMRLDGYDVYFLTGTDEDGKRLGPQGTPVEWVEEESYFFRLSAYQDKLLELYRRAPDFVLPRERFNEVSSFVRGGLRDLSISRTTFTWGIPVPNDPKHI